MFSYCVEVILITVCLVVYTLNFLRRTRPSSRLGSLGETPMMKHLLNAIHGSMQSMFSSAMIFSFTMVLATLVTFTWRLDRSNLENKWVNEEEISLYEPQLLVTASTFSMFPVVALHSILQTEGSKKRRHLRSILLFLLYTLCSALIIWLCVEYVYSSWRDDFWFATEPDIFLSEFIYDDFNNYAYALFMLMVALPAVGGLFTLALAAYSYQGEAMSAKRRLKVPAGYKKTFQVLIPLGCFFMMWVSMILLFYLRDEVIKDAGNDAPTEWTIGQILALANWGPVVIEFIYIFVCTYTFSFFVIQPVANRLQLKRNKMIETDLNPLIMALYDRTVWYWLSSLEDYFIRRQERSTKSTLRHKQIYFKVPVTLDF
jgi:hypothetical protein